ncbi:hypothetical protein ACFYOV_01980 [Streptomyces sp. NPDC005931]|uniref:hypothetical protein n=1 Tax=Streptomyces sp. NPDC005931 TaxID=3364737 RepID=UPI00369D2FFB
MALGVAGALAGGVGLAQASAGTAGPPPVPTAASASPGPACGGMHGGMHSGMHGGGHGGMGVHDDMPIDAAAKYLGLSRTELQTRLHAGTSLADIAEERGKSVSGLKDAMIAALEARLDDNASLTADEKRKMLAQAERHIDVMVNTTHGHGGGHGPMSMRTDGM